MFTGVLSLNELNLRTDISSILRVAKTGLPYNKTNYYATIFVYVVEKPKEEN